MKTTDLDRIAWIKNLSKNEAIRHRNYNDCHCKNGKDCEFCLSLIKLGIHAQWKLNKDAIKKSKRRKMNTKHTKGPWVVSNKYDCTFTAILNSESKLVAELNMNKYSSANAKLIAAAPEMLSSLKALTIMIGYAPFELGKTEQAIYDSAIKLIKKAEGNK